MPKYEPATAKAAIATQAVSLPPEEKRQILKDRLDRFREQSRGMWLSGFYIDGLPNQRMRDFNELLDQCAAAGVDVSKPLTNEQIEAQRLEKEKEEKDNFRAEVRRMIAAGEIPAPPPCPADDKPPAPNQQAARVRQLMRKRKEQKWFDDYYQI